MTVTRTTYTLQLSADGTDLGVPSGTIKLDALNGVHVTGKLTIPAPTLSVYDALNPRSNPAPRVNLTINRTEPSEQNRYFELYVIGRRRQLDGTLKLTVASSESVLYDYCALEEDRTPLLMAPWIIREIVTYVLDAAGFVHVFDPSIATATVEPVYATINRVINTTADDLYGYALGNNATDLAIGTTAPLLGTGYVRWTSLAAGPSSVLIWIDNSFRPFEEVSGSVYLRTGTAGLTMGLMIRWIDSEGGTIREDITESIPATGTGWSEFELHATAPAGTVRASFIARGVATAAGQTFALDYPTLNLGPRAEQFHPDTETSADYNYAPAGEPNRSVTLRELQNGGVSRSPESLIWSAGQSTFDFLAPLLEVVGLRLVCGDTTTDWEIRPATYTAPGLLTILEGSHINDGDLATEMGEWGDAAVVRFEWTDLQGNRRLDVETYGPSAPRRVITVDRAGKPAGNGTARAVVERALSRGESFSVRTAADWTAQAQQRVYLQLGGINGYGKADSIEYDLDADRMTVTGSLSA